MIKANLYKNAPIVEAIFDIKVDQTEITDVTKFEALKGTLLREYPLSNKRVNFQGKIELNTKENQVHSSGNTNVLGYVFSNPAGNRKIQLRTDGFSCNYLKPYTNWKDFSDEAFKYWDIYKTFSKPSVITRVALRFINRIELPLDNGNLTFEDYLNSVPKIPNNLPQIFNRFFVQMQIPCDNKNSEAIISQTFEDSITNYLPFIIDVDVFNQKLFVADKDLNEEFNNLRVLKNKIFESLITDKTRELFN